MFNFPGFSTPSAAWLFALAVPLVVFYFLKLRRPRVEIPSLLLWRQVLDDRRVNSPFQRFKRNLLLLLQLLLLALLVLAATQPFLRRGDAARAHRRALLVDCSASMAALDRPGGTSRLDAARRRVRELVDNLLPGQELALVSFAKSARKRTDFTGDRRLLREALDALQTEDVAGDLEDVLRLTGALARGAGLDSALLLSDGNFPARTDFELPFHLDYERLPPAGPNLGITALGARRGADGGWEVFAQTEASAGADLAGARLELRQDGEPVANEPLRPREGPAGGAGGRTARLGFRVPGEHAAALEVRLLTEGFDSLAADNVAFLNLPAVRPLRVSVPPALGAFRQALAALPGVSVEAPGAGAAVDLLVTDRPGDLAAGATEARVVCTVGFVPPDLEKLLTIEPTQSQPVDWRREAPLLRHVELGDLILLDQPTARPDVSDAEFANAGYEVLAHGPRGPLLLERRAGDRRFVHLLFHPDRSTLPFRVGFPVLVANLVGAARELAGLAEVEAGRAGVLPPVTVAAGAGQTFRVQGPGGERVEGTTDARGVLAGVSAPRVGGYQVFAAGEATPAARLGVSLLSPAETTLGTVEQVQFREQLSATVAATPARADRPLWFPLALGAFALLLVEWWFFQRRPAG